MKIATIAGVLLIVLGLGALAYQRIDYTTRDTVLDIGPIHATAERHETLPLSPLLGVAALAGGVALVVAGMRRRAA
jgi:hypothetical protein